MLCTEFCGENEVNILGLSTLSTRLIPIVNKIVHGSFPFLLYGELQYCRYIECVLKSDI